MDKNKNLLLGCTGSVASLKLPDLVREFLNAKFQLKIVVTENAQHFFNRKDIPDNVTVLTDADEWLAWSTRGDPVVHIDLGKWADIFVIAPLDANTLAKLAMGLCDNLLTCVARAWDLKKPLLFCPAMNTRMFQHPATAGHIGILKSWGYQEVPVVTKTLVCGDVGPGAMAEVQTIVKAVTTRLSNIA